MPSLRFSLRQLLAAVAGVALLLLLVRYAMRDEGFAVGLLTVGAGAVAMLAANLLLFGFLRVLGRLYGYDPEPCDTPEPPSPLHTVDAARQ